MEKELTPAMPVKKEIVQFNAETLISQAIDQKVPVETMEKLLAMRRELKAEWAKEQFDKAMANFQGECPVIKKQKAGGKTNSGIVAYYYAPLESIVDQTKKFIKENGFSYMIQTQTTPEGVEVVCIVKHKDGHSENSKIAMPLGNKTGVMSAPQVVAAALTFAKRYAFQNAFGILTGDDDNDAQSTPKFTPKNPLADIKSKIKSQIDNLTAPQKLKTAEEYRAMVLSLTATTTHPGLELVEKNYQEINNRLAILIGERKEKK